MFTNIKIWQYWMFLTEVSYFLEKRHKTLSKKPCFFQCSVSCGEGLQHRAVACRNINDGMVVSDDFCLRVLDQDKPLLSQMCAAGPCTASWVIGPWSEVKTELPFFSHCLIFKIEPPHSTVFHSSATFMWRECGHKRL